MTTRRVLVTGSSGFIGNRLMQFCNCNGIPVTGLDIRPARKEFAKQHVTCDLLDKDALVETVREIAPTQIVHLAARTDLLGRSVDDYPVNSDGVANLITAVQSTTSIERCLFTSSQLVCRVGYIPKDATDFCPPNPYGESKVLTERIVRESAGGGVTWCIFRPTTIWGPGMNEHYASFFNHLLKGRYFHMGHGKLHKSYGFVGNTAFQIAQFLKAPKPAIHEKVFYLADYIPLSLRDWIDGIAAGCGRPTPPTFPIGICRFLAGVGNVFQQAGMGKIFPLNTTRLNNILTEYQFGMNPTEDVCGALPYDFHAGLDELIAWINSSVIVNRDEFKGNV